MLLLLIFPIVVAVIGLIILWARYRRLRRERDLYRDESQGLACTVCEISQANYRLACELHGQRAVDEAVRKAQRGENN